MPRPLGLRRKSHRGVSAVKKVVNYMRLKCICGSETFQIEVPVKFIIVDQIEEAICTACGKDALLG